MALGEATIVSDPDVSFLSDVERSYVAAFRHPKRVDEFVAGRAAARRAIASLVGERNDIAIERHADGAPKVVGVPVALALSITHASRRAVAVAAEGNAPLGIDFTPDTDVARIRRVAERAFPRKNEREMMMEDERATKLAWAVKESIGKALRIGLLYDAGFERIELVSLAPIVVCVDGGDPRLTFDVVAREDGVLVVAVG